MVNTLCLFIDSISRSCAASHLGASGPERASSRVLGSLGGAKEGVFVEGVDWSVVVIRAPASDCSLRSVGIRVRDDWRDGGGGGCRERG